MRPSGGGGVLVLGNGFSALRDALSVGVDAAAPTGNQCLSGSGDQSRSPGGPWCRFGTASTSLALEATRFNDSAIECPVPPRHPAGNVTIEVSLNGLDWSGGAPKGTATERTGSGGSAGGNYAQKAWGRQAGM